MKSFSRLLLPWLSPAAAWQGAAEAIEGTENAHKDKEKNHPDIAGFLHYLQNKAGQGEIQALTPQIPPAAGDLVSSLLPLTLHVPAEEQQCAPCRAPGSSEISSSDDKTYLKTLNPRKIKAMTRCHLQNSISFVKKVLIANM